MCSRDVIYPSKALRIIGQEVGTLTKEKLLMVLDKEIQFSLLDG